MNPVFNGRFAGCLKTSELVLLIKDASREKYRAVMRAILYGVNKSAPEMWYIP